MQRTPVASTLALLTLVSACAHAPKTACPHIEQPQSTAATVSTPRAFGFADPSALTEDEPLALYDVRWMLLTGESGALVEVPAAVQSFTLGRWECALSAEDASDAFADGHASVKRGRRVACTHPTGLTMQTEVSCAFAMPSRPSDGSPRSARHEARIALGDAPPLSLACEPFVTERLQLVKEARQPVAEVCLRDASVVTCAP